MVDTADVTRRIEAIISELDPADHAVAIAHLRDGLDALAAVQSGEVTKFALHERLIKGQVAAKPVRRKFR